MRSYARSKNGSEAEMFTGIIESMGQVLECASKGELTRYVIRAPAILEGVKIGDSVAVNGTCLTVTEIGEDTLAFDAIPETLLKTNLGDLKPDSQVNLERAMLAGARFDGHIVQGHVDATGSVRVFERQGEDVRLVIDCGAEFAELLVDKGSVTIDGVSLTVVTVEDAAFDVALIPHTLQVTILGKRQVGERVNLEADVLGKYIKKYAEKILRGADGA